MRKHNACLLALLLLFTLPVAAQVLNENYNYLLQFKQAGNWGAGIYGQTINFYGTTDQDSAATYTTPFSTLCYYSQGATGPEVSLNIFSSQTQGPYKTLDLSMRGFYKGSPIIVTPQCRYTTGTTGFSDDAIIFERGYLLPDARTRTKVADNYTDFSLPLFLNGTARFREFWRYGGGAGLSTPLRFGEVASGTTVRHSNNNLGWPINDAVYANYGYNDIYGTAVNAAFTATPDVSYTFSVAQLSTVAISTDFSATNFDTRIHLVKITGIGIYDFQLLKTNDNRSESIKRSYLTDTLCAGTYGIIVEGSNNEKGLFTLGVSVNGFASNLGGTIAPGYMVPRPQEQYPLYISNATGPVSFPARFSPVFSWESSTDGVNWSTAAGSRDSIGFILPPLTATTKFRRVYNVCGTKFYSNTAEIKVVNPNGAISGRVESISGAGVTGIAIVVYKNGVSLPGSTAGFIYRDTTDDQGYFSVQPIYYGDPSESSSTQFVVKAVKANHRFDNDSLRVTLTNIIPQRSNLRFIDSTVYSISGKVYQECNDCTSSSGAVELQTCPLDSVRMSSNVAGVIPVLTGYSPTLMEYGTYALSVQNPGPYNVVPSFRNHLFLPPVRSLQITGDAANINFNDTTTHVISGKLTAGCGDYIGTAQLEFTDILPDDAQGNPRGGCFRKVITTSPGSGVYSVRLPARKYKVRVLTFSATADVSGPDLVAFFETNVPKDSLKRDITERDTVLNLVYHRLPQMVLEGLDIVNTDCVRPPADSPFVVIPQGVTRTFLVRLYQGPAVKACPVADTTLVINTTVQKDDVSESISMSTVNGVDTVRLKGGVPNIIYPFYKPLNIRFTDVYGRLVQETRNVVVTGLKANIGSFVTVSPEVPLMILHDPPGDNSFSFWETSRTNETAVRFYSAKNANAGAWGEVKIGTSLTVGLGVATETSVWGTIRGSVDVAARKSTDEETILTTTTTENFSTASNSNIIGSGGDVFIGAALNLKYALTNEIVYTPPCSVVRQQKLMVANDGFRTQYIYTENHIRNTLIPQLITIRDNPLNTTAQTNFYANQISVWEQALANNDANKRRATFVRNTSFDGSAGPITSSTTSSCTKNSTIEFSLEIDAQLAAELGFEAAGSGVSGGVNVGFKMETGNSRVNTTTASTTFGYTLDDDDDGDFFSVDIKKDPVYNTPVFELAAGTSSCPNEAGTQPRDEMQLVAPVPVVSGVAPDGEAEFILQLGNTSQSGEERTYKLSFVQSSNPNGAEVKIGGVQATDPIEYTIGYLGQLQVVVKVKRGLSNVFSYEGLQFMLTDACDGSIVKTVSISAFFNSTCSNIVLASPENNWVHKASDNNILPVLFKGYNLNNLSSVTLEYSKAGLSNWVEGFTRAAAQINNSSNGTLVNWNVSTIPDGVYNLRMKLNCTSGVVYSERVTGVIDRKAPQLLGRTQPTDDNYIIGDIISADYNEPIDCNNITNYNGTLKRLSNGQLIDVRLGCYQNNIVIVPLTDITRFPGDSMEVTLRGISDVNGNMRSTNDTWNFIVGNTVAAAPAVALKLVAVNNTIAENSGDSMLFRFELPSNAPNDIRVNYVVSGNCTWNTDYTIGYGQPITQATSFNGSQGSIFIRQGTRTAILKIKPIADTQFSANKVIVLKLAEGGDYVLGDTTAATGTIVNDDVQKVYTFTGNGLFTDAANWQNNKVPPYLLPVSDEIVINPAGNGECVLNVPLRMRAAGKLTVVQGKKLQVNGQVRVVNY